MVRFTLKAKISLVLSLLLVGLLLVTSLSALTYFQEELKQSISQQQFTLLSEIANRVDEELLSAHRYINSAARLFDPELLKNGDKAQRFLDERLGLVQKNLFDNGIFLFDGSGRMVAETPYIEGRRGKDYSFRSYFQRTVRSGGPIISQPYVSSQKHAHPAVNLTAPIRNADGEIVGVLAGSLDLTKDNLLGVIGKTTIGRTGYLYLFNSERRIILHPDPKRIMQFDVPVGANLLFDRALEGFEGTDETVNSRGLRALSSFKHLASTDWILGANYPLDEAYAPIQNARYLFLGAVSFIVLISLLVVWLFVNRLTTPLVSLTHHIQRHKEPGRELSPISVSTRDEIGIVAQAFNDMMAEITIQQNRVRDQLAFLQTVIDTIPHPIYFKNPEGHYTGCNLAFEKIHGLPREQIVGRRPEEISPGDLPAEYFATDRELLEQKSAEFQIFEAPLQLTEGGIRQLLFYKTVFHDADGSLGGVVGTMIDITDRKRSEEAFAAAKEFSEGLLQNCAVPCFVVDRQHRVLIWNQACEKLTDMAADGMVGTSDHWKPFYAQKRPCLADLVIDESLAKVRTLYQTFAASTMISNGLQAEGWYPDIGGKKRYIFFEAAPIRDRHGNIIAAIETLQDMTARKLAEESLQESENNYRSLIDRSPDAILVHLAGDILFGNSVAATLLHARNSEDLVGQNIDDLIHPDFREAVHGQIAMVLTTMNALPYAEIQGLTLDGKEIDLEMASAPVTFGRGLAIQSVIHDIAERKTLQEKIWVQANFDNLTGLPNRRLFRDRLERAIARTGRDEDSFAVLFIDLDRLKEINDRLGHEAGDELLKEMGRRLAGNIRETDTAARMGGDEFTVLLPKVNGHAGATVAASRLLRQLCLPMNFGGREEPAGASLGIAFYPEDGRDFDSLLQHADEAMYRAKKAGGGQFRFFRE